MVSWVLVGCGAAAEEPASPMPASCDAAFESWAASLLQQECAVEGASAQWPIEMWPTAPQAVVPVPALPTVPRLPMVAWDDHATQVPDSASVTGSRSFSATPDNPRGPLWPDRIRDAVRDVRGPVALAVAGSRPVSEVAEVLRLLHDSAHDDVVFVVRAERPAPWPAADPALDAALVDARRLRRDGTRTDVSRTPLQDPRLVDQRDALGRPAVDDIVLATLRDLGSTCAPLSGVLAGLAGQVPARRCAVVAAQVPPALRACECRDAAPILTLLQATIPGLPMGEVAVTLDPASPISFPAGATWGEWAPKNLAGRDRLWLEGR